MVKFYDPLATFDWTRCGSLPSAVEDPHCVLLQGRICVGGYLEYLEEKDHAKVFISSTDISSWSELATPTYWYALTTYHSQLVVVGGKELATGKVTNKLWTYDADMNWYSSLPPMQTRRIDASAVTFGSGECLVVCGGVGPNEQVIATAEVMIEKEWYSLQPLPISCSRIKSTILNGNLYLMGGGTQRDSVFYCNLGSLLAQQSSTSLWNELNCFNMLSSCVAFSGHLVSTGGFSVSSIGDRSRKIHAFSPLNHSWVHIGDMPHPLARAGTIVFPTGELVVLGGSGMHLSSAVFKASLKVKPFDVESKFSLSALAKLEEAAGIKIMGSLAEIIPQIIKAAEIPMEDPLEAYMTELDCVEVFLETWLSGRSPRPSTWRSLLQVLREVGLEELCQQVEDCFHDRVESLEKLCRSVVISSLLEQRTLQPDLLHFELPNSIPTSIKHSISQILDAHINPTANQPKYS